MSSTSRICALYSHGPHYVRLLRHVRAAHPDATIVALVPPEYPDDVVRPLVDQVERVPGGHRGLGALRVVLQMIRAQRCTRLVVMFDSPRLRLLSSAARVAERYCYSADGRYFPLEGGVAASIAGGLKRQLAGRLRYAYIRWIVYHRPVGK